MPTQYQEQRTPDDRSEKNVDESVKGSFPASDPPAVGGATRIETGSVDEPGEQSPADKPDKGRPGENRPGKQKPGMSESDNEREDDEGEDEAPPNESSPNS